MNLKLSDWASIAELVSAIAVVVTLIFLVIGIRENTEITRAAAFDRNVSSVNEILVPVILDEEFSPLFQSYIEGRVQELSSSDWFRVAEIIRSLFRSYESAYHANQYGDIGETEWTRVLAQLCFHRELLGPKWQEIPMVLTEEFASFVETRCPNNS